MFHQKDLRLIFHIHNATQNWEKLMNSTSPNSKIRWLTKSVDLENVTHSLIPTPHKHTKTYTQLLRVQCSRSTVIQVPIIRAARLTEANLKNVNKKVLWGSGILFYPSSVFKINQTTQKCSACVYRL